MLDFILGLILATLLVRGWTRGLVRELLDLVALVVGLWIAFRLSAPLGDFLTESFGVTPEAARIGAGIVLFVLFGAAMSVAAHYLSKVAKLPGLNMVNRIGGSAVATGWGVVLVLLGVMVARALPLPSTWEQAMGDSTVVSAIAGPQAVPRAVFERLVGDDVFGALASIQSIFGTSRAVPEGDEVLTFPPATSDEIRQVRDEASRLLMEMNRYRAGLGLRALQQSEAITNVAEDRGVLMYTTGRLSRDNPPGRTVADVLEEAGVRVAASGEGIALAGTALAAFDGIVESESGRAELSNPAYDRTGIAVVDGPTGRLVVLVLAG